MNTKLTTQNRDLLQQRLFYYSQISLKMYWSIRF